MSVWEFRTCFYFIYCGMLDSREGAVHEQEHNEKRMMSRSLTCP